MPSFLDFKYFRRIKRLSLVMISLLDIIENRSIDLKISISTEIFEAPYDMHLAVKNLSVVVHKLQITFGLLFG